MLESNTREKEKEKIMKKLKKIQNNLPTRKAVIYARVSSKEQEREGFSIPAQLDLLRQYAIKNNYTVVKEFEDVETAKKAGRTNYKKMIEYFSEHSDTRILLVEKTDRLYRNLKDYVNLENYDLEVHLVKENSIICEDSRSHDKFVHGIKVLMAKNYIDNLSEEVRKGLRQKAREGYVTGKAPYGYTKKNKNDTIIDEYTAPFVRRAFQIYSAGNISLEKTCQKLLDEGFCYKNNQPRIYRSQLEHILKNPFYYGMVCFKDEIYQGVHKPLISKELFDEVQKAFKKDNKPKHLIARDFLFGGVLRCANCGCIVSGEIKKGKYIYYSCTGAKRPCEQKHKYIRESVIERQIVEAIERIKIDEKQKSWIQTVLAESFKDEQKYTKTMLNSLNKQKEILSKRIETIYLDKLDGKITEEFWLQKHEEWSASLSKIQNKILAYEKTKMNYIQSSEEFLKICSEIPELYKFANNEEKQKLTNYVLQNFLVEGETLHYEYKLPFNFFALGLNCNKKLPRLDSNQQPTG